MTRSVGSEAAAWWRELQPREVAGRHVPGDRGALARLRRCATVMQAATERETLRLCRRLGAGVDDLDRVALVSAVLAHVRQDVPRISVARQIGVQQDGIAVMSDLRFRRLLQAETPDEKLTGFRRLVALAGCKLNVADLASGLWNWDDERTRRRWIYAYHDAPDFESATDVTPPATEDVST
jgi:CRISPR system Cascade subunit CasB